MRKVKFAMGEKGYFELGDVPYPITAYTINLFITSIRENVSTTSK